MLAFFVKDNMKKEHWAETYGDDAEEVRAPTNMPPPKGRKTMSVINPLKKDKGSPVKNRPSQSGKDPNSRFGFNASSPRASVMMPHLSYNDKEAKKQKDRL